MKKSFKKLLALVLAFAMCAGLCAVGAGAEGENVAKIGETEYATLSAAVTAAQYGNTIELISDANEAITITGKTLTLDLQGHNIKAATCPLTINGGSNVTIKDSTGTANTSTSNAIMDSREAGVGSLYADGAGTVVYVDAGFFYGFNGNKTATHAINGATITFRNCVIEGARALDGTSDSAKEGKVFYSGINNEDPSQVPDETPGLIVVEGGTFRGRISNSNWGEYEIKGGTFDRNTVVKYNNPVDGDGKPTGVSTKEEGTFTLAESGWLADGFVVEPLGGGTYGVVPAPVVAKIGDKGYATLQDALDAAKEMTGDVTVTLLSDITEVATIEQKDGLNITLDGDGKTITGQIYIDGNGRSSGTETLTIKGVKFVYDANTYDNAFIYVKSYKTSTGGHYNYAHNVTVKDCEFAGNRAAETVAFRSASGAGAYNIVLNNLTVTTCHSLAQLTGTTGVTVTNCTVTNSESGINISGGEGAATISNNNFNVENYAVRLKDASATQATLSGNTFTAPEKGLVNSATSGAKFTVESGDYTGPLPTDSSKIEISGGTFSVKPDDAVLAEGVVAKQSGDKWVVGVPKVAQIGDTPYRTLAEAVAAVPVGTKTTITMIDSEQINVVGSAITIPAGKDIVLDLNGYQVVGTAEQGSTSALITNRGTLTIKDSSTAGTGQLISGATVTWIYDGDGNYAGSYASNTITNSGTLTIESGYIENLSTGSATYAIDNNSSGANAIANINGGTVKAHSVAIRQFANSTTYENTVNISGGTVEAGYSGIWIQLPGSDSSKAMKAALNVTGGTLTGGSYAFYDYSYGNTFASTQYTLDGGTFNGSIFSYGANITINGGTYNGDVAIKQASAPSEVSVTGGYFTGDVYTYSTYKSEQFISGGTFESLTYVSQGQTYDYDWMDLLAAGKTYIGNADGTYTVVDEVEANAVAVAQIGTAKYATLAAAANAAKNGDTITMLKDVTLTSSYTEFHTNVTLDLNGKAVTGGALDVYGDMTITNSASGGSITGARHGVWVNPGARLTVAGGTIISGSGLNNKGEQDGAAILSDNGNVVITGGTLVNSEGYDAITSVGGTLTITGGTMTSTKDGTDAICIAGDTTASISGGTITGHDWGVTVFDTSILNVSDTAVIGTDAEEGYGICTSGNDGQAAKVTISGGTITGAEVGVYAPSGDWTISGGTISGATGVYFKSQKLNISGGTINGTGPKVDYNFNGNGANATGDALVIDSCNYPNGLDTVSVSGGTFNSTNAESVASYTSQGATDVTKFITGGRFNKEPDAELIVVGKEAVQDGDYWIIEDVSMDKAFTFKLVPTGDKTAVTPDIVDANAGQTVTVEVWLTSNFATDLTITSYELKPILATGLTYSNYTKAPGMKGSIFAENGYIEYVAGSNGRVTIPAGEEVKLGTLTLNVAAADSGLKYKDQLTISLDHSDSNLLVTGKVNAIFPEIVDGMVEIVDTYTITWNVDGVETTQTVGLGEDPTNPTSARDFENGAYTQPANKPGFTFDGWSKTPGGPKTDVSPATENTTYYVVWKFDGAVVFIDYAYAAIGDKMILIGLDAAPAEGNAIFYGTEGAFFTTDDANYLAELNKAYTEGENAGKEATSYTLAYVFIVSGTETRDGALAKLVFAAGTNKEIVRDGDINGSGGRLNAADFGIVDDLLAKRESDATVEMRLKSDVVTSPYTDRAFGDVDDIIAIINMINGTTSNP